MQIRRYTLGVTRELHIPWRDIEDMPLWLWRQCRQFVDDVIRERSKGAGDA